MAKVKKPQLSRFAQALTFLSLSKGCVFCQLENHTAIAFDDIIAAGIDIEEDLNACPQLSLLLTAILRCEPEYAITQLSLEKLYVRGNNFQAYIPCLKPETLRYGLPDAPVAEINDKLKDALLKVVPLVNVAGETLLEQSVQVNAGTCLASDRTVVLEAWHGCDLPNGVLLPKSAITAIQKAKKKLSRFGYSGKTATFWFEDQSWIRTQLFQGEWPHTIKSYLNVTRNRLRPVPPKLFESASKVAPFSIDQNVYIRDEIISSHPFDAVQEGSELALPIGSAHLERSYPIHCLNIASKHAELWDETARLDGTYFEGENIRGLISHRNIVEGHDDDIPF